MIQLDSITLPPDLVWPDEFTAQGVAQVVKRTLDGGVLVFHQPLQAGQSITLESSERHAWVKRSVMEELKVLADSPGLVMSLQLRGRNYSVLFRHNEGNAFEAEPIIPFANPSPDDYYTVRIRLMTV